MINADVLTFDAKSVRSIDENGFMRISISPFTKEQVAPYYGREIPGWENLGLDPEKTYMGYRPAEELQKAETIESINGIPVQFRHHPDFSDAPAHETRVGAAGTDAEWREPYLMNSLIIYDDKAKDVIKSGFMRELSLAYRYDPEIKEGEWNGKKYDFIMRNIRANHIALVEEGRAGADVLVYDSKQKEDSNMPLPFNDSDEPIEKAEVALAQAIIDLHKKGDNGEVKDITEDEAGTEQIDTIIETYCGEMDDDKKSELKNALMALAGGQVQDEDPEVVKTETAETEEETTEDEDPEVVDVKEEADAVTTDEDEDPEAPELDTTDDLKEDEETEEAEDEEPKGDDVDEDPARGYIEDRIKACGFDEEPEEVKNEFANELQKAFAEGVKYGEKKQKEEPKKLASEHESEGEKKALSQDSAYISAKAEIKKQFVALNRAIENVKPVLGKVRIDAYDSAEDVYMAACKQLGIKCNANSARDAFNAYSKANKVRNMAQDSQIEKSKTVLTSIMDRVNSFY